VVFLCHQPALWGKIDSVYKLLSERVEFKVSVVAVPYKHPAFSDPDFRDRGMVDHLTAAKIPHISAWDSVSGGWLDLQDMAPDYVFYQTPYDEQYPMQYRSAEVSMYSRICYVPYYGILIYDAEVADTTHPESFLRHLDLAFVAHEAEQQEMEARVRELDSPATEVVVTGAPMLDAFVDSRPPIGGAWNDPHDTHSKRILWTPRWNTAEGNCHFFDYWELLLQYARARDNVDFLYRPHPLSLAHLATTGELDVDERAAMFDAFDAVKNAGIDRSEDYRDVIRSSDILVSDISSIMVECLAAGKAIVYTHRRDCFNGFGRELAQCFYWVRSAEELTGTLDMLLSGEDPLAAVRSEMRSANLMSSVGGAAEAIRSMLEIRYRAGQ